MVSLCTFLCASVSLRFICLIFVFAEISIIFSGPKPLSARKSEAGKYPASRIKISYALRGYVLIKSPGMESPTAFLSFLRFISHSHHLLVSAIFLTIGMASSTISETL